jgi:uncharacterized protein (TIGR02246 family)
MKTIAVVAGVALLAGVGLVRGQQPTDPALNRLASEFAAAFNAKDAKRITTFYTDDGVIMPPDQGMVRGRRDIEAYYTRDFQQDVSDFRLIPIESVVSGEQAFEAGTSRLTHRRGLSSRAAVGAATQTGKYLVVYKRVGGSWRIAYDIFNND